MYYLQSAGLFLLRGQSEIRSMKCENQGPFQKTRANELAVAPLD